MEEQKKVNTNPRDVNSFFDEDTNSGFKFKDLVFMILRNLPYFVVCALVGGIISYYNVIVGAYITNNYLIGLI